MHNARYDEIRLIDDWLITFSTFDFKQALLHKKKNEIFLVYFLQLARLVKTEGSVYFPESKEIIRFGRNIYQNKIKKLHSTRNFSQTCSIW